MKRLLSHALLATLALSWVATPLFASAFGLFYDRGCCSKCGVTCRPYNAFTPVCCCSSGCSSGYGWGGGGYGGYGWGGGYGGYGMGGCGSGGCGMGGCGMGGCGFGKDHSRGLFSRFGAKKGCADCEIGGATEGEVSDGQVIDGEVTHEGSVSFYNAAPALGASAFSMQPGIQTPVMAPNAAQPVSYQQGYQGYTPSPMGYTPNWGGYSAPAYYPAPSQTPYYYYQAPVAPSYWYPMGQ